MGQNRPPSAANQELANWLSEEGYPTTPRQIRTWRSRKWIDPAIVEPQGYARATKTSNPPSAFDQALALAEVKNGRRMNPNKVVFALFARGHSVPIDVLRAAYAASFGTFQRKVAEATYSEPDPFDAGEKLAVTVSKAALRSRSGRYMRRKAMGTDESPLAIVETVWSLLLACLLGGSVADFSTEAFAEAHRLTGIDGFVTDTLGNGASISPTLDRLMNDNIKVFEHFTLDRLISVAQSSSIDQLCSGREQWLVMTRFMRSFASIMEMTEGPANAFGLSFTSRLDMNDDLICFGAVLMVALGDLLPGRITQQLPTYKVEGDRYTALLELLKQTPEHLRCYLGLNGQELQRTASEADRRELLGLTTRFQEQFPDLCEAVKRPAVRVG